jgi:VWFA-related protein
MLRTGLIALAMLVVCGLPEGANPQQTVRLDVDLALVTVRGYGPDGKTVTSFQSKDFHLYEDGIEQTIAHFDHEQRPIVTALLIDTSGSMKYAQLNFARLIAKQFIESLHDADQLAIFDAGAAPYLVSAASGDKSVLLRSLEHFIYAETHLPDAARGGGIYIDDTVCAGVSYVRQFPDAYQKTLAVITDNETMPPNACSREETISSVWEADAVVLGFTVGQSRNLNRLLHGDVGHYAEESGGEVIHVQGGKELLRIPAMVDRLRSRYVLGYYSTKHTDLAKHRIRLDLSASTEAQYGKIKVLYNRRPMKSIDARSH